MDTIWFHLICQSWVKTWRCGSNLGDEIGIWEIGSCSHCTFVRASLKTLEWGFDFKSAKWSRISKFCLRKECQLRLEARRIIQLFPVGLPPDLAVRLSFFRQIMIGNKSYWRRHFKPTDNRFLIRRICCRWQHTPYTLSSYHKNLSKTQDGKVKYINIYINISDICRIYPTYASMRIGKYIRNGHWPSLFLTPSPTEEVLQSCVSVWNQSCFLPCWKNAFGMANSHWIGYKR